MVLLGPKQRYKRGQERTSKAWNPSMPKNDYIGYSSNAIKNAAN